MNEYLRVPRAGRPIRLSDEDDFRLGELDVRPSLREIGRKGTREQLEPRVMQVLVALAAAQGAVVSRDELIQRCWDGRIVGEAAINRCISMLREIAESSGAFTIETIPRVGYRLIPSAPAAGSGEDAAKDGLPPVLGSAARFGRKTPYPWIFVAAIAVIAAALAFYQWRIGASVSPAPSAGPVQASIAVLPFKNLSSDKDTGYLADGVQDEVLTRLANVGSLKVISRTSTEEFSSRATNIRDIAKKLGVANVLEGNVQKSGDKIRINVQLIRAADDDHLWAQDYDRKVDDLFSVESEVAGAIATALAAKVTPGERAEIAARPTDNPRAYDLFLRGLVFAHKNDDTSLHTAIQLFQQAVAADPKFAVAWARLARMQAFTHFGEDLATVRRGAAHAALAKALELNPDLAEVQAARGFYLYYGEMNYPAAQRELEGVHARWPNNADALEALALVRRRLGGWKESTDAFAKLVVLDPLVPTHRITLAGNLMATNDFAAALRVLDDALRIWPDNGWILATKASVYQALGRLDLAGAVIENVHPAPDDAELDSAVWEQFWLKRQFGKCANYFKGSLDQDPDAGADVTALLRAGVAECLRRAGDTKSARENYSKALELILGGLKVQPNNTDFLIWLPVVYSGLGDSRTALASANHAIGLFRASNDQFSVMNASAIRLQVMAASGDRGAAIAEVSRLMKLPGGPTPALLRLDPQFDRLRGDPRFEALAHSNDVQVN